MSKRLWVSKPGSIFCACCRLRTNKPVPTSAIRASATSHTTSPLRSRTVPDPPASERAPERSALFTSAAEARKAGASPKSTPVKTASTAVKPKTRASQSSCTASCRRNGGRNDHSNERPQYAIAKPAAAPSTASSTDSVSSCRTSRERVAPSAARILISRERALARASSRFARLTQAMSSTTATTVIINPPARTNCWR